MKQRLRSWFVRGNVRGFGLTEILIGILLSSFLILAASRWFFASTRKGTEAVASAKASVVAGKALHLMMSELANLVAIPTGVTSLGSFQPLGNGTKLRNRRPAGCYGTGLADLPGALVPLPGYSKGALDAILTLDAIDPSILHSTDNGSDAIRFAYLLPDSVILPLATHAVGSRQQPYPTMGSDPIRLKVSDITQLSVGDYAMISDSKRADLFRVTSIEEASPGVVDPLASPTPVEILVGHSESISIWNQPFDVNYGMWNGKPLPGGGFVQKIGIATYAHDSARQVVFRDSHRNDDGFDGTAYSGTPALAHGWSPYATGVAHFRFEYVVTMLDVTQKSRKRIFRTRTPVAGIEGESKTPAYNSLCQNQIGLPLLAVIRASVLLANGEELDREINPWNLPDPGNQQGGATAGNPLHLNPTTPTPTFDPSTPTPGPPTATPDPNAPTATPYPTSTPTHTPNPSAPTATPTSTPNTSEYEGGL